MMVVLFRQHVYRTERFPLQLNNAQAHFRSGRVCNEAGGHALLLLATPR